MEEPCDLLSHDFHQDLTWHLSLFSSLLVDYAVTRAYPQRKRTEPTGRHIDTLVAQPIAVTRQDTFFMSL
jgi:hypothetical protein